VGREKRDEVEAEAEAEARGRVLELWRDYSLLRRELAGCAMWSSGEREPGGRGENRLGFSDLAGT
jgi:hypothetical protein